MERTLTLEGGGTVRIDERDGVWIGNLWLGFAHLGQGRYVYVGCRRFSGRWGEAIARDAVDWPPQGFEEIAEYTIRTFLYDATEAEYRELEAWSVGRDRQQLTFRLPERRAGFFSRNPDPQRLKRRHRENRPPPPRDDTQWAEISDDVSIAVSMRNGIWVGRDWCTVFFEDGRPLYVWCEMKYGHIVNATAYLSVLRGGMWDMDEIFLRFAAGLGLSQLFDLWWAHSERHTPPIRPRFS